MKGKNTVDIKVSDEMENNKLQRSAVTARTAATYSYSSYKGVEYAMKYAPDLDARNVSITNYLQNASFTKARGIHFKAANFSS